MTNGNRTGYDEHFLGEEVKVPVPTPGLELDITLRKFTAKKLPFVS